MRVRPPPERGGGPETTRTERRKARTKTNGSNAKRRETRKASQVSTIAKSEEKDFLGDLQVIEGKPFVKGPPEPWFRQLYKVLDGKGLLLEQFPKLKLQKGAGGFFLSKKFVRTIKTELREGGAKRRKEGAKHLH